jgi:transcriptional regulator with XRE-family HTH domain
MANNQPRVIYTKPDPQPLGRLITAARKRARLSGRRAADRAGISDGRWRQIVNGYEVIGTGVYRIVDNPPAETVARIAQGVDLTPEELEEVGRADAAEELRNLTDIPKAAGGASDDLDQRIAQLKDDPGQRWWLERMVELIEDSKQMPAR